MLDYVVSAEKPVSLGELSGLLKIERSSTHRLMATLIKYGYVVQDDDKMYLPGPAIMELASKISHRVQVHDIAKPYLNDLASQTGEACHLGVLGRGQVVLTDCVSSNHALAVTSRVGQNEPIYCTALGKALVCEHEQEQLEEVLGNQKFKKYSSNTLTSFTKFEAQCKQISECLVAKDDEEFRVGIRCLASPIKDFTGKIVAAIGISGPKERLDDGIFEKYAAYVKQAGIELSQKLGFRQK